MKSLSEVEFLSTLSLRRATFSLLCRILFRRYFYPRSPCGERPCYLDNIEITQAISIHALLAESDNSQNDGPSFSVHISIHALLAESDMLGGLWVLSTQIFLSTLSLRRATPPVRDIIQWEGIFLSTLSLRRATARRALGFVDPDISIHALLAESDMQSMVVIPILKVFLSTLSLRRATRRSVKLFRQNYISIHALLAESDSKSAQNSGALLRI